MSRYLLGLILPAALVTSIGAADLPQPTDSDRAAVRAAVAAVADRHLLKPTFDAAIVNKGLDAYIDTLDPNKAMFTKEDLREFDRGRADLANGFKNGDIKLVFDIYRRYQKRAREYGDEAIAQLSAGKFDFAVDESHIVQRAARQRRDGAFGLASVVRSALKYSLLGLKEEAGKEFDLSAACKRLIPSYKRFLRGIETATMSDATSYFLNGVFGQLDPQTRYLPPKSAAETNTNTRGSFFGIGARLEAQDEGVTVTEVFPEGPAGKDGRLKAGDRIVQVGQGDSGGMTDVREFDTAEAIPLITGPEGSTVRLAVIPKGGTEPTVIALKRGRVHLEVADIRDEVFTAGSGARQRKVGYIALPSLYSEGRSGKGATADVRERLARFTDKKVDVVILDLRNNGGGPLAEAIRLTGLFVTRGPVFQQRDRFATSSQTNTVEKAAWDRPLVVLTNRTTASGAEIVCAAVQDYARGLIVGDDATYGLGTIANLRDLSAGGMMQVTTHQFYRVNGESVQRRGVQPDIVLPSLTGIYEPGELSGAIGFDRIAAVARTNQEMLDPAVLKAVTARSAARRGGVAEFDKLDAAAEKLLGQKRQVTMPLREDKFLAARKADQLDLPPAAKPGERDFYLNEVLAIAADYAFQLRDRTATTAPPTVAVAPPKPVAPPVKPVNPPKPVVNPFVPAPKPPAPPVPNPAEYRAAQRREIQVQILETERTIELKRREIDSLDRQIAGLEADIAKGTALMKNASTGERLVIGSANLYLISQKSELAQKRNFARIGMTAAEDRLVRLRQDLIRLQD